MAFHMKMIEKLKSTRDSLSPENPADKEFIIEVLAHASDLNNSTLEFDNYIVWAKLISMEFQDQTTSEKNSGVPVTQMFVYKDELAFYKGQSFFVGVLVAP